MNCASDTDARMPLFSISAVKSGPTFLITSASDRSFKSDACIPFEPDSESDPCDGCGASVAARAAEQHSEKAIRQQSMASNFFMGYPPVIFFA